MSAPASDDQPFPRRRPRRLPLFWDRASGDGRPCRACGWVMYIWADGKGFVWQMCRRCDIGAGS